MSARLALVALAAASSLAVPAAAQDADVLNPVHAIDRAVLKSFVDLPLFDPARRLPPPPAAEVVVERPPPPPPLEPPPSLQLVGVLHGRRDIAIVHKDGGADAVILRDGEHLGAWTVVVRPLGLTLRDGGRSVDFTMFAKGGVALPPPQPPVAVGRMMRRPRDE